VELTTPPCKTWICLEPSTEASEEEEGWGDHDPKTGRSATEEEDEEEEEYDGHVRIGRTECKNRLQDA
jgi:hypothetical protein